MGIDAMDIVFKLEQRLRVKLDGPKLAWQGTVADFSASVMEQLPVRWLAANPDGGFEEFRDLLARSADLQPERITRETVLSELLGPYLPRVWRRMRRAEPQIPELCLTRTASRWQASLIAALMALTALLVGTLALQGQSSGTLVLAAMPGVFGTAIIVRLFARLRDQLPDGISKVADVLPLVLPRIRVRDGEELSPGERLIQQEALTRIIRGVLVDALAVDYGKTRLDARLIEDLGMS